MDALIRISVEGPELEDYDFCASIDLWRQSKAYRHIFTGIPLEHDESEAFVDLID